MIKVAVVLVLTLIPAGMWGSFYAWHYFDWDMSAWYGFPLLATNMVLFAGLCGLVIEACDELEKWRWRTK